MSSRPEGRICDIIDNVSRHTRTISIGALSSWKIYSMWGTGTMANDIANLPSA